jgi:hypothetical protein
MTTLLRNVTESTVDAPASAESAAQPSPLLEGTREQASSPPEDDAGMQGGDGSDGSISAGVARESQGVEVAVAQTANIE